MVESDPARYALSADFEITTGVSLTCGNFTNCGNNTGGWLVGAGVEYMRSLFARRSPLLTDFVHKSRFVDGVNNSEDGWRIVGVMI